MAKMQINSLTSLRGIAAWWVVLFHFRDMIWTRSSLGYEIAGLGYLAVDLFFIMSGFVIQMSYGEWFKESFSWKTFKTFMLFRLARIYPLHLFMSILFLVNPLAIFLYSHSGDITGRYDPLQYICSLFLIHNWGFLGPPGWNVPSWSISVELAAYLMFPMFTFCIASRLKNVWGIFLASCGCLCALDAIFFGNGATLGEHISRLGIWRCVFEFGFGVTLFQLRAFWAGRAGNTVGLFAGLLALVVLVGGSMARLADYWFMPLAFGGLVLFLSESHTSVRRVLETRALIFLGEISYSTYLCHYFLKDWAKFLFVEGDLASIGTVFGYLMSVLLSSVILYRFVEMPGRHAMREAFRKPMVATGVTR